MNTEVEKISQQAKLAAIAAANLTTEQKNNFLLNAAVHLEANIDRIVNENQKDVRAGDERNLSTAMIDRLMLDAARIQDISKALREIAALPDPVGKVVSSSVRPNGLKVERVRIPLGVIGIIYESRPNVTVDAAALCLKSGNAVVLRGGSEAFYSNQVLTELLQETLQKCGLDRNIIQSIPTTDRNSVYEMLKQDLYIDLIIPRGGPSLMQMVREHSKIPVIKHDKGVCHLYIDGEANLTKAEAIAVNGKVQRPGVCNALETILVDQTLVKSFLPTLLQKLQSLGVEIHGCEQTQQAGVGIVAAKSQDWDTEYLTLKINVRVVDGIDGAITHIQKHTSLHTEAIVTENESKAKRFVRELNSSAIMVNASTRFNDGGQLGLGAEIGISTTKLHAFGPMGLEELTTTKFVVIGDGQIRE